MTEIIAAYKKTRQISSDTFFTTLKELLDTNEQFSEIDLSTSWLKQLQKYGEIFPTGWYIPPPSGIAILFGNSSDERISFKSLRPEEFWPKENSYFLDDGIMLFYASPVSREGIIGDFGAAVYLGKDLKVQDHFKKTYELIQNIFEEIEMGMKLSEVYAIATKLMNKKKLYSDLLSPSDPAGTNIGHTIVSLTSEERIRAEVGAKSWNQTKDIISKKRVFVSSIEKTRITPGMAITLEPRPQVKDDPSIPMAWFHSVVIFGEDGKKELVTGFDEIFKLVGANYILD